MFPIEHRDPITVKDAAPLLRELFAPDPLGRKLIQLRRQARRFASLDGMPKQFKSDAKSLTAAIAHVRAFVRRGDTPNAVLRPLQAGALAQKLALQAEHEKTVLRVNTTTRKLREGFASEKAHAPEALAKAIRLYKERLKKHPRKAGRSDKVRENRNTRKAYSVTISQNATRQREKTSDNPLSLSKSLRISWIALEPSNQVTEDFSCLPRLSRLLPL